MTSPSDRPLSEGRRLPLNNAEELRMLVKLENRSRDYVDKAMLSAAAELDRLQEVLTFPILTPEASSSALFLRVLSEHEKGQPVNAQDLINALMWRVGNQRRELARKNQDIQELTCGDPRKVCPKCRDGVTS